MKITFLILLFILSAEVSVGKDIIEVDSSYKSEVSNIRIEDSTELAISFNYYIRIFPCPIVNTARFLIYSNENLSDRKLILRIYDINGNLVEDISRKINYSNYDGKKLDFRIDLSNLTTGVYIIQLISGNKTTTQKLLKL